MRVLHCKNLIIGEPSWKALRDRVAKTTYVAGAGRGFLLEDTKSPSRIRGKYVHTRLDKEVRLDPATLLPKEVAVEVLAVCRFELDFQKGLVMAERSRADLNGLHEALDSAAAVDSGSIEFEDLNIELLKLMFELQGAYKKNVVKSVRIRDYLARENMLANASFKVLEPQDGEKIAEKFDDQLDAFTLTLKLPDGACAITVTRKGTVKASDDAPDELLLFVKDLLPRFHSAEVGAAEVVAP